MSFRAPQILRLGRYFEGNNISTWSPLGFLVSIGATRQTFRESLEKYDRALDKIQQHLTDTMASTTLLDIVEAGRVYDREALLLNIAQDTAAKTTAIAIADVMTGAAGHLSATSLANIAHKEKKPPVIQDDDRNAKRRKFTLVLKKQYKESISKASTSTATTSTVDPQESLFKRFCSKRDLILGAIEKQGEMTFEDNVGLKLCGENICYWGEINLGSEEEEEVMKQEIKSLFGFENPAPIAQDLCMLRTELEQLMMEESNPLNYTKRVRKLEQKYPDDEFVIYFAVFAAYITSLRSAWEIYSDKGEEQTFVQTYFCPLIQTVLSSGRCGSHGGVHSGQPLFLTGRIVDAGKDRDNGIGQKPDLFVELPSGLDQQKDPSINFICEVKPPGASKNEYFEDLWKVMKLMKGQIDLLLTMGVQAPKILGCQVFGVQVDVFGMRLAPGGRYDVVLLDRGYLPHGLANPHPIFHAVHIALKVTRFLERAHHELEEIALQPAVIGRLSTPPPKHRQVYSTQNNLTPSKKKDNKKK